MDKDNKKANEEENGQQGAVMGFSETIKNAHASGDGAINRGNEAIEDSNEESETPDKSIY